MAGALQKVVDDNVVHGWQALLGAVCSHAASDAHDPGSLSYSLLRNLRGTERIGLMSGVGGTPRIMSVTEPRLPRRGSFHVQPASNIH